MPPRDRIENMPGLHVATRDFSPIYNGLPAHTAADPYGLLPYLRRIRREKNFILEWNNRERKLQIWKWPTLNEQRVAPSELNALHRTHGFYGPCCLCASQDEQEDKFTEAAMFLVTQGWLAGEYVAACANSRCKYWSFMERLYNRRGLPIRTVMLRPTSAVAPLDVEYTPEEGSDNTFDTPGSSRGSSSSSSATVSTPTRQASGSRAPFTQRPMKRARTTTINENIDPFAIPTIDPVQTVARVTPFSLLMQLDNERGSGGISEEQFRDLFAKCRCCRVVTTKRVFKYHKCAVPAPEVIDLTADDV